MRDTRDYILQLEAERDDYRQRYWRAGNELATVEAERDDWKRRAAAIADSLARTQVSASQLKARVAELGMEVANLKDREKDYIKCIQQNSADKQALKTLDSEREANAILTARVAELEAVLFAAQQGVLREGMARDKAEAKNEQLKKRIVELSVTTTNRY